MYVVTVVFEAVAGRGEELEQALLTQSDNSLREEVACLRFDVARDGDDGRYFLYEIYEDEAAFEVHKQTPHYKSFNEKVAGMIASKSVERWTLISETP
jgi:quinol monooxygenase YgiN